MLFSNKKSTEDYIIEILITKEYRVRDLCTEINESGHRVSIQSVYNRLNDMIASGIIIDSGVTVSVSEEWKHYVETQFSTNIPPLHIEEGESVTYTFNKFEKLDIYWKHIHILINNATQDYPTFYYLPHYFWIYIEDRKKSESDFLQKLGSGEREVYTTIGGKSKWDQLYKIKNTKETHQIDLAPELTFKRTNNLSIIGDYIITTQLSEEYSTRIDEIYEKSKSEKELDISLNQLVQGTHTLKIKLSKNKSKSLELRKKLSKNMYIPKSINDTHNLC